MNKIQLLIGIFTLFFVGCSSHNDLSEETGIDNKKIELSFHINNFEAATLRSAFVDGSTEEQTIQNMYVFLFPTTSTQTLKSYYISTTNFTGGSWNTSNNTLLLNLTQSEAGKREVYIVANCLSFKTILDGVVSLADLQLVLQSNNTPWTPTLKTPILMSGNKNHDFNSDYQLNNIPLERALAKVQLNIKLSSAHQGKPLSGENTAQYKYRFFNLDKDTYILKPASKPNNLLITSAWSNWNDAITSYILDTTGKITNLSLVTYLNERDNTGTAIEISLPYFDGGFLPPPEFGDETYKLQLPDKVERNRWYIYDVEI